MDHLNSPTNLSIEVLDVWHPCIECVSGSGSHSCVSQFIPVFIGFQEEGTKSVFGSALYLAELLCASSSLSGTWR